MRYSIIKADKSNIIKTNLEVLKALLNNFQLCHYALGLGYIGEN